MKRISYLLMIIFAMGFVSCSKDGSEGPLGPRGERGERGEQGSNGMDGKTVLNGTSNPVSTVGDVGDFYINTNSYLIFGPKTATDWGSGKSILGSKGDKGDKGAKGDVGATGPQGDKGDSGAKGDIGTTGAKGDKGDQGNTGDKGDPGATGAKGEKGEADYVILNGGNDPVNTTGKAGDFYYNTTSKTLFFKTASWTSIVKLSNTIQFSKTIDVPAAGLNGYVLVEFDLPFEVFKNSMTNVYLSYMNDLWIPLPGYMFNDELVNIVFDKVQGNENQTRLQITRVSGSVVRTNSDLRIVVTEADVFRTISTQIDFRDYNDVKRHFQLGN